jgi:hypothetical protein
VLEHDMIAGIGNDLFGSPLSVTGPKGTFPTIATATRIEWIGIGRYQPGEFGLRAVMIDTEAILALESVRQSAIHTLGRTLLLESRFVAGIVGVGGRSQLPSVTGLGISERVQKH